MGLTWGRQDPDGPHVGLMNLAIMAVLIRTDIHISQVVLGVFIEGV